MDWKWSGWWGTAVLPQTREELETNSQKQGPTAHKAQGCDRCGRTNCSCAMVRLAVGDRRLCGGRRGGGGSVDVGW